MNTTNLSIAQACDRAGEECTMPREVVLLQDENSGRDGRRYNEWHASRPDARLNAREAAAEAESVALAETHNGAQDWPTPASDANDDHERALKLLKRLEDADELWKGWSGAASTLVELKHAIGGMAQKLALRTAALAASLSCERQDVGGGK